MNIKIVVKNQYPLSRSIYTIDNIKAEVTAQCKQDRVKIKDIVYAELCIDYETRQTYIICLDINRFVMFTIAV